MAACKTCKNDSQPIGGDGLCDYCRLKEQADLVEWWEKTVEVIKGVGKVALGLGAAVFAFILSKRGKGGQSS